MSSDMAQALNDKEQIEPILERLVVNEAGNKPKRLGVDAGHFSEADRFLLVQVKIDAYIATDKLNQGKRLPLASETDSLRIFPPNNGFYGSSVISRVRG
jgi:hypothetical protein